QEGNRCPLANDLITFELDGPAEWRGGIAQGKDNYILATTLPVEGGINRVLLRSTPQHGTIRLKAKSGNLKPAEVIIETKDVGIDKGLSTYYQSAHLPSYLEKGPTPATPSFTVSRHAIEVASVKSGSNEEEVTKSYDDNERSQWVNDGKLSTAWINYTLEREADLSEICVKFSGWRNTSYPIEIFVEGKPVWQGNTPRNLGYTTFKFDPVRGKEVLIRMTGSANRKDAFQGITEVDPTVDLD